MSTEMSNESSSKTENMSYIDVYGVYHEFDIQFSAAIDGKAVIVYHFNERGDCANCDTKQVMIAVAYTDTAGVKHDTKAVCLHCAADELVHVYL